MKVDMIDEKLLRQAVEVLRRIDEHNNDKTKRKMLFEDRIVYCQMSLKKIPKTKGLKMIKVNLKHPYIKDPEVCLIMGDRNKRDTKADTETDILYYKDLLKREGIHNISEVYTLRELRTAYKQFEAKQKLLAGFDLFLTESKIAECLPRVLGKHFFRKRKFPIQINGKSNLKRQIEKAVLKKIFYISGRGNSCASEVANLHMSDKEIVENVTAMIKSVCNAMPEGLNNISGIYLKTSFSKAVPIHISYDEIHEEKKVVEDVLLCKKLASPPPLLKEQS